MNQEKIIKLSDVVSVISDNEYEPIKNNIKKYVAGGHIEGEKFFIKKFGDVEKDKDIIGSAFHKLFKKGDLLYKTRFPNSGAIVTFDGLCSNTTLVLQNKKESEMIKELFPFIFHWDQFKEYLIRKSVGSTNSYIRWRDLAEFEFVLPNKDKQLEISKLFWSIQNLIDSIENLLEKTKIYFNIKTELLLTKGFNHKKFKKIQWFFKKEIEISKKSSFLKIDDLFTELKYGSSKKSNTNNIGLPILGVPHIIGGSIKYENIDFVDLSKEETEKFKLKNDDILIVRTNGNPNYIARSAIFQNEPKSLIFASYLIRLRIDKNKILPNYMLYYLQSSLAMNQFRMLAHTSAGNFNINTTDIRSIRIIVPEISEQKQIISILSKINQGISKEESYLKNLYALRTSILNLKLTSKEQTNVSN